MMYEEFVCLTAEDCAAVAALEAACFPSAWKEGQYRALMEKGICRIFGVRRNGKLLAYIALGVIPGVPDAEVYNIAVDPAERCKGFGKKLLCLALSALAKSGTKQVLLEVRESNQAAITLYEGAGFVVHGRRAGYYAKPLEDARLYIFKCPW